MHNTLNGLKCRESRCVDVFISIYINLFALPFDLITKIITDMDIEHDVIKRWFETPPKKIHSIFCDD